MMCVLEQAVKCGTSQPVSSVLLQIYSPVCIKQHASARQREAEQAHADKAHPGKHKQAHYMLPARWWHHSATPQNRPSSVLTHKHLPRSLLATVPAAAASSTASALTSSSPSWVSESVKSL